MNKNRFCWTWGVGAWGVTTAVAFAACMSQLRDTEFLPWLGISLVGFLPGGYLFGRIMWNKLQPNKPLQPDGASPRR